MQHYYKQDTEHRHSHCLIIHVTPVAVSRIINIISFIVTAN